MRICQLINLAIAIFLVSCAAPKVEEKHDERLIHAHWLKVPQRFALRDKDDNYLTHPFFDLDPTFKKDKRTIRFFITTPEDSSFKYNIDLYSGRLYKEHDYCAVDDVWEFYKGSIEKPNFTQGIVPRMYDENNNPQRIVIFGDKNLIEKFKYSPTNFDNAKIIGSVLLDSCESFPCDTNARWKSSQILLGVSTHDESFSRVNLLNELKSKVDWTYTKGMLVNQDGVHNIGKYFYPAFRISKELSLDETIQYYEKHSTAAKMDELVKWRDDCFKLYDDLWTNSEKIRGEKLNQQDKFLKLFKEFYKKNSTQFYSCQKLVRPGTINDDTRRLWFFSYVQAFMNLEKNNFYYSCGENSWQYNPKVDDAHFFNDQGKELERCHARDFEKSFDQAINGLAVMRNQINKSFHFVEYDSGHGGSHQKIYAWIPTGGTSLNCKTKSIKENQFDLFPQDVVWQSFSGDEDKTIK